jgi:hypothetical protein
VPKALLNVQDVFGFVVFHASEPVTQCVEGYPIEPWVLNLLADPVALPHETFSHSSEVNGEDPVAFLRQHAKHGYKFATNLELSGDCISQAYSS